MADLTSADKTLLWKSGRLAYQLHAGQKKVYTKLRGWQTKSYDERKAGVILKGLYPRVFMLRCSRRWGKDRFSLTYMVEEAIRRPGSVLTYATAYQRDVIDILLPLMDQICEDCPEYLRPVFKTTSGGAVQAFYFPNKSMIKVAGIDSDVNKLRGRFSDGFCISESAFVDKLRESLVRIIMPQLQGRLHAFILLNSTPSPMPGHFFDTDLYQDALERDACIIQNIEDNPLLTHSEREEFIAAAGGRDSEDCRREYYCEIIRNATSTVVPEFDIKRHVKASKRPKYAYGFSVIDPGVKDLLSIVTGYYDFERAVLVIRRCWGERNANTNTVAAALQKIEAETFGGLQYWSQTQVRDNPVQRFSDIDARMILDLNSIHKIKVAAVNKDSMEAMMHSLRNAFQQDKIEIHPDAMEAAKHVENAIWTKSRTQWERSDIYGHFDHLASIQYMWRSTAGFRQETPFPPRGYEMMVANGGTDGLWLRPHHLKTRNKIADALNAILPKRRR